MTMNKDVFLSILAMDSYNRGYGAGVNGLSQELGTGIGNATVDKNADDVEEEIDTARSELANAQGRVAMSTYRIDYAPITRFDGSAAGPLARAWSGLGDTFGSSLASVITFISAALPWLIVFIPLGYAIRAGIRRFRKWRADRKATIKSEL